MLALLVAAGAASAADDPAGPTTTDLLAAGEQHFCSLRNGDLRCWGVNATGQLGDQTRRDRSQPQPVLGLPTGSRVVQLALGGGHSCALLDDGALWCWGRNHAGQCTGGPGEHGQVLGPTRVKGLERVQAVASGSDHVCAIVQEPKPGKKRVLCWGENMFRQLATETWKVTEPVEIPKTQGAKHLAAAASNSCALLDGGDLVCWGVDGRRTLWQGPGEGLVYLPPTRLAKGVSQVLLSAAQRCEILDAASLRCRSDRGISDWTLRGEVSPEPEAWAVNSAQLCLGTEDARVRCQRLEATGTDDLRWDTNGPTVPGLAGVRALAASRDRVCALTETDEISCWDEARPVKLQKLSWRPLADIETSRRSQLDARSRTGRQAGRDPIKAALWLARSAETSSDKSDLEEAVVRAMIDADRIDEALGLRPGHRWVADAAVGRAMQMGRCQQAFSVHAAQLAQNPEDHALGLLERCGTQEPMAAWSLVRRLEQAHTQARDDAGPDDLRNLALVHHAIKEAEQCEKALRELMGLRDAKPEESAERAQAAIVLGRTLADVGQPVRARATLRGAAEEILKSLPAESDFGGQRQNPGWPGRIRLGLKGGALDRVTDLAAAFAAADDHAGAREMLKAVADLLPKAPKKAFQLRAWSRLAVAMKRHGRDERGARSALRKALRLIPQLPKAKKRELRSGLMNVLARPDRHPKDRKAARKEIVVAAVELGDWTLALKQHRGLDHNQATPALAAGLVRAGRTEQALALVRRHSRDDVASAVLEALLETKRCPLTRKVVSLASEDFRALGRMRTLGTACPKQVPTLIKTLSKAAADKRRYGYQRAESRAAAAVLHATAGRYAQALRQAAKVEELPARVEAVGAIGVIWSRAGASLTPDIQAALQALIHSSEPDE